jgi:hypothetical protein
MTSVATNQIANAFRNDVRDAEFALNVRQYDQDAMGTFNTPVKIQLHFEDETLLAKTPAALIQHLDLLMCHGAMSDAAKNSLTIAVEATSDSSSNMINRAKGAILALLAAPDCVVHE